MATKLPKSKHGEGIGGTIQEVTDPNNPSYDPASKETATDRKIRLLMALPPTTLTQWEQDFLLNIYGAERITKQQHVRVAKMFAKHLDADSN